MERSVPIPLRAHVSRSGFVFSLDSLIAVSLIITATFLFISLEQTTSISSVQSTTIVDDTLFALENTGYIIQTIDTNAPTIAAGLIRDQILAYLPNNFDANVSVSSYTIDTKQCNQQQNFASCFPDSNVVTGVSGTSTTEPSIPGKKYFLRRQPPGDCNVSFIEFAGPEEIPINWNPPVKKEGALFIQANFAETVHIDFNITVDPSDQIVCDQNIFITLTASTEESLRKPIEIMIVMDRSRPAVEFEPYTVGGTDKNVMEEFLFSANWTNSNCTGPGSDTDCIGMASYDDDSEDSGNNFANLTSARNAVRNRIRGLDRESDPSENSIAEGVEVAIDTMIAFERPVSSEFIVVISDAADTSDSTDLITEAQRALDNNITIFSVGFGADVNSLTELETLANTTGGTYYYAEDSDALQALYNIIANRITNFASDSNVVVPIIGGAYIIDLNTGVILDGNIVFDAGSITPDNPWSVTYILNFPCDSIDVCGLDAITFPGTGSYFGYTDQDGNSHIIDFNSTATLDLKVRDLNIDIIGGEVLGINDIVLDVRVQNVGELDANATNLRFYLNDTEGLLLEELIVPPLCS
ncbi:VWA domain-containing protein, partial [archaeon]|nr:VWA domain-containing protein [archaeon]